MWTCNNYPWKLQCEKWPTVSLAKLIKSIQSGVSKQTRFRIHYVMVPMSESASTYLCRGQWEICFAGNLWHIGCKWCLSRHLCRDIALWFDYRFFQLHPRDGNHMLWGEHTTRGSEVRTWRGRKGFPKRTSIFNQQEYPKTARFFCSRAIGMRGEQPVPWTGGITSF